MEHGCPACLARCAVESRVVEVQAQHATYFPIQPDVQQQLTQAVGRESYRLMRCPNCDLEFTSPMVAPGQAWYEIAYRALEVKPEQRWEYGAVISQLTADDSVYEIGCGTGAFLKSCGERRVVAAGIDFWPEAVESCRKAGLQATLAHVSMTDSALPTKQASAVASFQVLEHLDRPDDLFRHAHQVSQPGGTLWVSVPSNLRVARVLELSDPMDDPPHHLTKWSQPALEAVGRRTGWDLKSLSFEPFTVRNGLWSVACQFALYDRLRIAGWLQNQIVERILRATLYPAAAVRLLKSVDRRKMTGMSMLARYRRAW
jgi:SAM-dependent methyltransferase